MSENNYSMSWNAGNIIIIRDINKDIDNDICDHLCNIELPFHWGYILNIQTQVWKTLTYFICTVTNIIYIFRAFFKKIAYYYIIHEPLSLLCKQ